MLIGDLARVPIGLIKSVRNWAFWIGRRFCQLDPKVVMGVTNWRVLPFRLLFEL